MPDDRRVVVLSVPGLTWKDLEAPELSNLRALLDESAIANVATRVTSVVSEPGEAYLTLGTGTRAVAPREVAGLSFQADEPFGATTAGDEYAAPARRRRPTPRWCRWAGRSSTRRTRAPSSAGTIGALGQALDDAGVGRGVVANADGADPLVPGEPIHREAALTLADTAGATPCGQVSPLLLDVRRRRAVRRPPRPGGGARGLRPVQHARTRSCWSRRPTCAGRWPSGRGPRRSSPSRPASEALASTDALAGAILDRLDPERDAVVVVAPSTQPTQGLGVLGIKAAELEPGFLTSGNTRRAGYVLLTDLTPTIAAASRASSSTRPASRAAPSSGATARTTGAARRAELVDAEAAARFRDRVLDPVVLTVVDLGQPPGAGRHGRAAERLGRGSARGSAAAALVLLAFPSLTYLAARVPVLRVGRGGLLALPGARLAARWALARVGARRSVAGPARRRLRAAGGRGDR